MRAKGKLILAAIHKDFQTSQDNAHFESNVPLFQLNGCVALLFDERNRETMTARIEQSAMNQEQQHALKAYVRMLRAADSVTVAMHRHLARHQLTISQFGVLEALYHVGPLCQKELAAKILKSGGNLTMVIDNLEKRELVRRVSDKQDRRKFMIMLTDAGHALIAAIFPTHAEIAGQLFSVLSPEELDELGRLLRKLGKGVKAADSTNSSARSEQ